MRQLNGTLAQLSPSFQGRNPFRRESYQGKRSQRGSWLGQQGSRLGQQGSQLGQQGSQHGSHATKLSAVAWQLSLDPMHLAYTQQITSGGRQERRVQWNRAMERALVSTQR